MKHWLKEFIISFAVTFFILGAGELLDNGQHARNEQYAARAEHQALLLPASKSRILRRYPDAVMPNKNGSYNVYIAKTPDPDFHYYVESAEDAWHTHSGLNFKNTKKKRNTQIRISDTSRGVGRYENGYEQTFTIRRWPSKLGFKGQDYNEYGIIHIRTGIIERDKNSVAAVIEHEIGHAIGLKHVDNPDDLMYYNDQGNNWRQKLSRSDIITAQKINKALK